MLPRQTRHSSRKRFSAGGSGDEEGSVVSACSSAGPVTPNQDRTRMRNDDDKMDYSASSSSSSSPQQHRMSRHHTPPSAPRAPKRSYRLSDEQRQDPTFANVARKLTFDGHDNDNTVRPRRARRAQPTLRNMYGDEDGDETLDGPLPPLLALDLPDRESRTAMMARKMLGSPIRLDVAALPSTATSSEQASTFSLSSSTSSTPSSPGHSFRSFRSSTITKRKRSTDDGGQGNDNDSERASSSAASTAPSTSSDGVKQSPRRQQPKRACTMTHVPLVVQRRLCPQGNRSTVRTRRHAHSVSISCFTPGTSSPLIVEMPRTLSCTDGKAASSGISTKRPVLMPLRAAGQRNNEATSAASAAAMGRSNSHASYLAQTPNEHKPTTKVVVAPTLARAPQPFRSSSVCSPFATYSIAAGLRSSSSAQSSASSTSMSSQQQRPDSSHDYFGNWSAMSMSPLAEAH